METTATTQLRPIVKSWTYTNLIDEWLLNQKDRVFLDIVDVGEMIDDGIQIKDWLEATELASVHLEPPKSNTINLFAKADGCKNQIPILAIVDFLSLLSKFLKLQKFKTPDINGEKL